MCGIAGLVAGSEIEPALLERMGGVLHHRGPDDGGTWIDRENGIGLAHRRLAIVDLSPHGHQPMTSADGRWTLCYNGEIYNHSSIRQRLEAEGAGPPGGWRGHSDTETLLQAIACWGLEAALGRAVGMFAFALWDARERRLQLVRDRFGEKPLYYGWCERDLVFASELKALRTHPGFRGEIDRRSLAYFAGRTYVPAPFSIYRGIFKLPPGSILTVERQAARHPRGDPPQEGRDEGGLKLSRYWDYRSVVRDGLADPIDDEAAAVAELEQALGLAVADQAMADVPVGAFLSGGVDSSTIVALYQRHSRHPVRTFSIGFAEAAYNEADHARAVAEHLGTVHHEQIVTPEDARQVIPLLPAMYDEPFADSSQIPTYLVSRFARSKVTVALTGDGGDELLGGYNRHIVAPRLWARMRVVPATLRRAGGTAMGVLPASWWAQAGRLLPGKRQINFGGKVRKGLHVAASAGSFDEIYESFLDEWAGQPSPVIGGEGAPRADLDLGPGASDLVRMMYADAVSYLPDDILCKVDRASMAVSLETRVPFLDHRVAELAARISPSLKVREGRGKHVLRQLLYRHVPPALIDRPKAGFGIPVGEWIKGPLRDWAEDLLEPRAMGQDGWFDPAVVQTAWTEHRRGIRDATPALWAILMFQAWLRSTKERQPG